MPHEGGHVWRALGEHATAWVVGGVLLAATGFAPEEWLAHAVDGLRIHENVLHLWATNVDVRVVPIAIGMAVIGIGLLRQRQAAQPKPVTDLHDKRIVLSEKLLSDVETTPNPTDQSDSPEPTALLNQDKPSIAVLPFENMSGDVEQEHFSDGIADDITTELSRNRWLFVIARTSSFTYKNHPRDVKRIAEELGVSYVLEGSVRRASGRVRVNVQLVDAQTAEHIWAERYDRDVTDVFAVQDEITAAVTGAIAPAITDTEKRRATRKPPERLDAWEAYMRGLWHEGQGRIADHEQAKQWFHRALALDATFASPCSALSEAYLNDGAIYATLSIDEATELSAQWAERAIAIDPEDADAQATIALAAMIAGDVDEAHDHLQIAKASNPNLPTVLTSEEFILLFSGQFVEARQVNAACVRVDPRGPRVAGLMQHVAISYYYERDYTKSVEAARRAVARYPEYHLTYRWLAAALGQLGRTEEARVALQKAIELAPQSFEFYVRNRPRWHRPESHEHMRDGLRKAGWQG